MDNPWGGMGSGTRMPVLLIGGTAQIKRAAIYSTAALVCPTRIYRSSRKLADRIECKKVSGVEEGGGEPSSGSTPDKKSSDTLPASEPSSALLGSSDIIGRKAFDRGILPAFTPNSSEQSKNFQNS
jgi:hypothetical protein